MERLEPLWRAYEQFEIAGSNKLLAHVSVNHQCRLLNHLASATEKHIKGPWQCVWRGWITSGGRMSSLKWLAATSCWLTYQ